MLSFWPSSPIWCLVKHWMMVGVFRPLESHGRPGESSKLLASTWTSSDCCGNWQSELVSGGSLFLSLFPWQWAFQINDRDKKNVGVFDDSNIVVVFLKTVMQFLQPEEGRRLNCTLYVLLPRFLPNYSLFSKTPGHYPDIQSTHNINPHAQILSSVVFNASGMSLGQDLLFNWMWSMQTLYFLITQSKETSRGLLVDLFLCGLVQGRALLLSFLWPH